MVRSKRLRGDLKKILAEKIPEEEAAVASVTTALEKDMERLKIAVRFRIRRRKSC